MIKELTREMMRAAKAEEFERADHIKRQIFSLQHIQDVALIKDDLRPYRDNRSIRIEAYDIAHLGGDDMVGVMTVVVGDELLKDEYRKFKIKTLSGANDTAALKEVLTRRLSHPEWPFPQILVVDGSTAQKNAAEAVLRTHSLIIPVVAVVKDERHRPIRVLAPVRIRTEHENSILLANAESHRFARAYHTKRRHTRSFKT